jgi:ribose transport system ATP-binding protein
MSNAAPLLQMVGISKRYGATHALRGVSFSLHAGQVMALIGENGAGKSTLMKILSGAVPPDRGHMMIDGSTYAPRGPQGARRAGVAMIYQELNLAPHLSVADNIMLGQEQSRLGLLRRGAQNAEVRRALDLLGHPDLRPEAIVETLSVGAQQLVEIARALVGGPRLIVFDEPTSSLTRHDVEHLFTVIRRLKQAGIGVAYISHFLEEIREVCDSYTVLRDGESVGTGRLDNVSEDAIVTMMVGRSVDDLFPVVPHEPGEVILSLRGLSGSPAPRDVDLDVRRGEILGIAGLVGAGRTELMRAVFALDPVRRGTVRVRAIVPRATPKARIAAGLGMVSEDRKAEGLAQGLSIADNMTLSRLRPYSLLGVLNVARRLRAVQHWMGRLSIKAASPGQEVQALSGGNQQKVALARVLHQDADVLLLDEPTRGIDVGTKAEIYRLIGELAAQGKAILFVSSYLPELLAVCDSLGVMSRGRLRAVRATSQWTEEDVMATAIGMEGDALPRKL